MHADVIVAGLGIHGLMASYMLARRGLKVLALERHVSPHSHGSSHGQTRVHRRAYFEAPFYVPLLKRADELWEELGSLEQFNGVGSRLLTRTGVLVIGRDDGRLASGALESAREHRIHVKVLDQQETRDIWPGLRIPSDHVAILEPLGGVLQVEQLLSRLREECLRLGVTPIHNVNVEHWEEVGDAVRVRADGLDDDCFAGRLVLATGAWLQDIARASLPLTTERQFQVLYEVPAEAGYNAADFPAVAIDRGNSPMLYGIPDFGRGFKLALHHGGRLGRPEGYAPVSRDEVDALHEIAIDWLPGLTADALDSWTCIYTNTPDEQFIIDRHPETERVLLLSCCSGHGYKFGPVVGEIVSQLIADGGTPHDISQFRLDRFRQA